MSEQRIYLVGPRYPHHASHSGYDAFVGHAGGHRLWAPVSSRWLYGRYGYYPVIGDLGRRVDETMTALTPRPLYSLGILLIEAVTAVHMLANKGALYHILYGDTDVWMLGHMKRIRGNRVVATFHEPPWSLEWLQIHRIAQHLDAAILVSESQREYFEGLLSPGRILVIPHGVDTHFFQPAATSGDEPICITVGSHLRDFETFKATIGLVLEAIPRVRFIAVGTRSGGGGNSQLYDERVEFYDHLRDEDLLRLYQKSRIAIFSFHYATANNALLEAMSCGLPIVATDIGGVREYVGNKAGLLCPPYDPEAMAKATVRLLRDADLATELGAAGRARALQFDHRILAQQMRQGYSEVLASRKG